MNLEELKKSALTEADHISTFPALEAWKIKYLGRNSDLTLFLRGLAQKSLEQKRELGSRANELRKALEAIYAERKQELLGDNKQRLTLDVSQPGRKYATGHLHPLTLVSREILDIFKSMGFDLVGGPEIESEYYNFDALNIPAWHPARDNFDTFWLDLPETKKDITGDKFGKPDYPKGKRFLLRTHTSPLQIRYMQTHTPPIRMVAYGPVYRNEATDARHEFQLNQLEGLMIGQDVTLATLHYIVREFFRRFFESEIEMRLVPSYYPFVEPGVDISATCVGCLGKTKTRLRGQTCKVCGGLGWLEVAGAGMVHPNVLNEVGYDTKKYQGFAFGFGLDRLAMLKLGIKEIRMFKSGDQRFINQFS